jgi:hypothetical protein
VVHVSFCKEIKLDYGCLIPMFSNLLFIYLLLPFDTVWSGLLTALLAETKNMNSTLKLITATHRSNQFDYSFI